MRRAIPPLPQYAFMAWCSVKVQRQLYLWSQNLIWHGQYRSRDNSVGIAIGLRVGRSGFDSRRVLGIFLFDTVFKPALGLTQLPNQWVPEALSLRVKRPGREADHSPPPSAVFNAWSSTSTPQYVFMAWLLVKHRDDFTLPCKEEEEYRGTFYVSSYVLIGWNNFKCVAMLYY
jgi:hypothetical protein